MFPINYKSLWRNARLSGSYGLTLPQGNFNISFVNKDSREPAWPKYAQLLFQEAPDCNGYAIDDGSITLTKPSFDEDRCSQLIHDGDVENLPDKYNQLGQWQNEWIYAMKVELVTPGYGGSGYAVKGSHKKDETCNIGYCVLGQWLDSSCFATNIWYEMEAKVRLVDREGNNVVCDDDDVYCGVACE